ncbi:MAG: anaerobic ribonucleoside-triphosphate reductase [Propionivibrio sp.]
MRPRLPQIIIAPTFSICPRHGYLQGEHEFCPRCDAEAAERTRLPSVTVMPTFSICPKHGYLQGEHEFCPRCDAELAARRRRRPQPAASL